MSEEERRLRRAAVTRYTHTPEPVERGQVEPEPETAEDENDDAAAQRLEQQTLWVDMQVRRAMARGDFDNLPGAGKPLRLPAQHDPDWWVKRLIEREKLSGIAPPAIGLRREDAELDDTLDGEATEAGVRRIVEDFNRRVVEARRQLLGGPPVITRTRDPEVEVQRWRSRRTARHRQSTPQRGAADSASPAARHRRGSLRRWWSRVLDDSPGQD
jgi:hypothetical protein